MRTAIGPRVVIIVSKPYPPLGNDWAGPKPDSYLSAKTGPAILQGRRFEFVEFFQIINGLDCPIRMPSG
jgi:hypothetical protein